MRVLFLGTSAGWPLPRLGCHCPICSSSDKRDRRLRPALLVENRFLFDAPPDIYHHFFSNPERLKGIKDIFITHAHPDHILGLYDLTHVYRKTKGIIRRRRFNLFLTKETLKGIKKVFSFPLTATFNIHLIHPNEVFSIGKTKIVFFPVDHSRTPTFGIRLKKEKTVSYLPDFAQVPPLSQKVINRSDMLVLDGTNLLMKKRSAGSWGHADWGTIKKLAKNVASKEVFFTHIGHGHYSAPHRQLEKFVQKNGGKNWHIAYDDLKIKI